MGITAVPREINNNACAKSWGGGGGIGCIMGNVEVAYDGAAILVYQENPLGVELFSHANTFFCSNKLA